MRDEITPARLADELENATVQLAIAADNGLDRLEQILNRRSEVVTRIAACDPGSFTPLDLSRLRTSAHTAAEILQKITLFHRNTAAEWQRLNQLRSSTTAPDATISLSA